MPSPGVWVPRAVLRALDGDLRAALIYQQAAFVQENFEGPWSVPVCYWERTLGLKPKAARAAIHRLEERGWLSIGRPNPYLPWELQVEDDIAMSEIRAAEDELPAVTLWEVKGTKRKPSNFPCAPRGNTRARPVCPEGEHVVCPEGEHTTMCDEILENQGEAVEERPETVAIPDAGPRLVASYPHPSNGRSSRSVPSAQQAEMWIAELHRRGRLEWAELPQVLAAAENEARFAKKEPETYRKTLRNWLWDRCWLETREDVKPRRRVPDERPRSLEELREEMDEREELAAALGVDPRGRSLAELRDLSRSGIGRPDA